MRRLRRLAFAQRVVVIIALAGMLRVIAGYIVASVESDSGWFGYAPLSRATYPSTPSWPYALSFALIAFWAAVSVWLLGLPYENNDGRSP